MQTIATKFGNTYLKFLPVMTIGWTLVGGITGMRFGMKYDELAKLQSNTLYKIPFGIPSALHGGFFGCLCGVMYPVTIPATIIVAVEHAWNNGK